MRRLIGLVLPALLALVVLAAPAAAAAVDLDDDVLILAEEGVEDMEEEEDEGADLGPDPRPYDAEDNVARDEAGYGELDVPFTWGAAFIMLFVGAVGITLMGGLYWLLVHRPAQQKEAAGSR
jgi:hypothetical protein